VEDRVEDNSHAGQGAVVLDIGGDIGALIVSMPSRMKGIEVEIRPLGHPVTTPAPHVAVTGRPASTGVQYTLVFPEVHDGTYQLSERHHDTFALTARVEGGAVTYANWPDLDGTDG
jgi:hypothetical protein